MRSGIQAQQAKETGAQKLNTESAKSGNQHLKLSKSSTTNIWKIHVAPTQTVTCSSSTNATNTGKSHPKSEIVKCSTNTKSHCNSHSKLECKVCGEQYQTRGGLSKHVAKKHGKPDKENGNINCHLCKASFITLNQLISHLTEDHNIQMNTRQLKFPTLESFIAFKYEEELKSNTQYIQQCGRQTSLDGKSERFYYYCNRSGKYASQSKGNRQTKSQGSCKVGSQCTAHMKVRHNKLDGTVDVQCCDYHHSHELKLIHLRIPEKIRQAIAAQLHDGVTIEKIMDNIRDKILTAVTREQLVTRMDIHNIKRQYNIEGIEKSNNDLTSVSAWVGELEALEYNPITVFKVQGIDQTESTDNLAQNDFILGIQTKFQRDMMIKFSNNGICVDTTHKTNQYDFLLLTLMVLDEFGEGIPVGWMLSNREDGLVITEFLKSVHSRVGNLQVNYFMSDDAEQFFTAWRGVFGNHSATRKLLCSWHVDRAWRKALNELVPIQTERVAIYHHLRTLLQCNVISKFRVLLQNFVSWLMEEPYEEFCRYFQNVYCKRVEEWAFCYRASTPFNTNMFVESFHRLLKVVYLENKQNRRVDKLLHTLLRIARDKAYERLIKMEKGKTTHRVSEIHKRHQMAISLMEKKEYIPPVQEINGDNSTSIWKVHSTDMKTVYEVVRTKENCDCRLVCKSCNVCVHMYKCTCIDDLIHGTVCKHVHLVRIVQQELNGDECCQSPRHGNEISDSNEYFLKILGTEKPTTTQDNKKLVHAREQMDDLLKQLQTLNLNCRNVSTVTSCMVHVKTAIGLMKALEENSEASTVLQKRKRYAPNANNEKQLRFQSTKKRRLATSRWAKPTKEEVEQCRKRLMEDNEARVCGICFKEEDGRFSEKIQWLQCEQCSLWVHETCTPLNEICQYCNQLT